MRSIVLFGFGAGKNATLSSISATDLLEPIKNAGVSSFSALDPRKHLQNEKLSSFLASDPSKPIKNEKNCRHFRLRSPSIGPPRPCQKCETVVFSGVGFVKNAKLSSSSAPDLLEPVKNARLSSFQAPRSLWALRFLAWSHLLIGGSVSWSVGGLVGRSVGLSGRSGSVGSLRAVMWITWISWTGWVCRVDCVDSGRLVGLVMSVGIGRVDGIGGIDQVGRVDWIGQKHCFGITCFDRIISHSKHYGLLSRPEWS